MCDYFARLETAMDSLTKMEGKSSRTMVGFTEKLCAELSQALLGMQISSIHPISNAELWQYVKSQFNVSPNHILRIKSVLNQALKHIDIKREKVIFKKHIPSLNAYVLA